MIIVSIPLLGAISIRGYHPPIFQYWHGYCVDTSSGGLLVPGGYPPSSIQYWHGYCVDTSAGGLLVPGAIIHPVFSTVMVIVSIPLLGEY